MSNIEGFIINGQVVKYDYDELADKPSIPTQTVIDTTLSIQGDAADAKATGDAISSVKSEADNNTKWQSGEEFTIMGYDVTSGSGISPFDGGEVSSSSFSHTDYINVKSFKEVRLKRIALTNTTVNTGIAFYDKEKNYLSGMVSLAAQSEVGYFLQYVPLTDEVAYVRCSTLSDTSTYGDFEITGYPRESISYCLEIEPICPFIDSKAIVVTTGSTATSSFYVASDFVPCDGFDIVEFSRYYGTSSGTNATVTFYDGIKTYIPRSGIPTGVAGTRQVRTEKFVIPDGAKYLKVAYPKQENIETYSLPDFNIKLLKVGDMDNRINNLDGKSTTVADLHPLKPKTTGVSNAIKRAHQLSRLKWTPVGDVTRMIKTIDGTISTAKFKAGVEYTGVPYAVTRDRKWNINIEVSPDQFVSVVSNAGTRIYDPSLNTNYAYFGNVCSSFVFASLGIRMAPITEVMGSFDGMELIAPVGTFDEYAFELADILLDANNHVVLITGILTDTNGVIKLVEISEATLYGNIQGGKAISKWWTPSQLFDRFSGYDLYRYKYIDDVEYTASDHSKVFPEQDAFKSMQRYCCPAFGEGCVVSTNSSAFEIKISSNAYSDGYTQMKAYVNGSLFNTYEITDSTETVSVARTSGGEYRAYLETANGDISKSTHWHVYANSFSKVISGTTLTLTYDTDAYVYGIQYVASSTTYFVPCTPVTGSGTVAFTVASGADSVQVIFGDKNGCIHKSV